MQIKLEWYEPIELGSSSKLVETLTQFDYSIIPEISGVYIFYRQTRNGSQEALYVGKSKNIRTRFKQHCNNLALVEGLKNTPQGAKMFIFAEVRVRNDEKLEQALHQAERGYIQHFLENDHPLLNKKLLGDKFDTIIPSGENLIELVSNEIDVFKK